MVQNKHPNINLLKDQGNNYLTRFTDWALTTGRVLVIITEFIALSAFVYRFTLDRKLNDLNDEIKVVQKQLLAFKDDEEKFRILHNKIALIDSIDDQAQKKNEVFNFINNLSSPDITITSISFSGNQVTLQAHSSTVSSIVQFINTVRNYTPIQTVVLNKVENRTSSAVILIGLTVVLDNTFKN